MTDNRDNGNRPSRPRAQRRRDRAGPAPRPRGGRAGRARGRGLTPPSWLSNRRVRAKLAAVLVIPTVAFLALAGVNVAASVRSADAFAANSRVAGLVGRAIDLVDRLQRERDLVAGLLAGAKVNRDELAAERDFVQEAADAYLAAESSAREGLEPGARQRLDAARARLDDLPGLRTAAERRALADRAVFDEYTSTIRALLDVQLEVDQQGQNEAYSQLVRAFMNLSNLTELSAQVRGTLYGIAARGQFTFGEFQEFADLLANQRAALDRFLADANGQQRDRYAETVTGQAVLTVGRIKQTALNRQSTGDLDLDEEQWFAASATELELLHSVERSLLDEVTAESASLTAAARRSTVVTAAMIALTLMVAVAASFGVAESMARSLRFLRRRAQQIADERLPEAVRRLRTTVGGELDVAVEPVGIDTRDEIGDLAQAFDDVHRQAIRLAAEQAALRANVSAMFLNLARRSQGLVDRLLARISELEHEQTDPAELENLYLLDHLATRVRRNAENLVVLSGADPSVRRWGEPVPLADVVEAAIAEVEDYARVDLGVVDEVSVLGWAASDLTHLLAELIENATTFSPPSVPVVVTGAAVGNGYVLEVEDRGLGMTDDELVDINERLADPPLLDFSVRQRLGLYVVARLAQRYDVKVQLRHSAYGGVVALVRLPVSMLAGSTVMGPLQAAQMVSSLQAAAAGGDSPRLAGLTTLTSDWFTADVREVYMPLRPHGIRRVGALPRLNGAAAGPQAGAHALGAAGGEPPAPSLQPPTATVAPQGPARREETPPPVGPHGLPRRVPKPKGSQSSDTTQPVPPPTRAGRRGKRPRSPESMRSALANYQAGLVRGRAAMTGRPDSGDKSGDESGDKNLDQQGPAEPERRRDADQES
jgi:hypothetical protein